MSLMKRLSHVVRPKIRTMSILLLLLLGTDACATSSSECNFTYSAAIRDQVVIPTLKSHGQKLYKLYKLNDPIVMVETGIVTLIFKQSVEAVDGSVFVIVLDPCTLNVIKAYETPPTYVMTP